jgi:queuine tRNA-ribosyltransferase
MNPNVCFEVLKKDAQTSARLGRLHTAHGVVETPVFMPVGTQGTVKAMTPLLLEELKVSMILCNAYHLNDRPGVEIIRKSGGLHRFMNWPKPILTDSGGYQVFSLAARRKISDEGVEFNSHIDGRQFFIGPIESMAMQRDLGADVAMAFDECPPYPCDYDYACQAVKRTLRWASVCAQQPKAEGQLLFGIVQGGIYPELRKQCAEELFAMNFDGLAIGGVSVGEPEDILLGSVRDSISCLPDNRPRYLMGVGELRQMAETAAMGVDMFDCVIPTRLARNGAALTRNGRLALKGAEFKDELRPIEEGCGCYTCRDFSRAYLRHLVNSDEILGIILLTIHNIYCYMKFMAEMRRAIEEGRFARFMQEAREQVA